MSGSGMVSFAGGQYITSNVADNLVKTFVLFLFMTTMGVVSKLVLDRIKVDKQITK
jgi:hypothetical protein